MGDPQRVAREISRRHHENRGKEKPKTGLFKHAACDVQFKTDETYFVGDKASDVQAGKRFGLRTLFVLTGHGRNDRPQLKTEEAPEQIFPSLKEAVDYILK